MQIDDSSLTQILQHCGKSLKSLGLTVNPITDAAIAAVAKYCAANIEVCLLMSVLELCNFYNCNHTHHVCSGTGPHLLQANF